MAYPVGPIYLLSLPYKKSTLYHMESQKNKSGHPRIKSTHFDSTKMTGTNASSSPMTQSKVKTASFPKTIMVSEVTSPKKI